MKRRYEVKVRRSLKGRNSWSTATYIINAESETNAQLEAMKKYSARTHDTEILSVKPK